MDKNPLRKIPSIAVMIMIFIFSAINGDDPFMNVFEFSDKLKHFVIYLCLGLSFCLWIPSDKWSAKPVCYGTLITILCLVFGICDEVHQSFVPQRSGNDLEDLTADFFGGLLSPFAYILILRLRKKS